MPRYSRSRYASKSRRGYKKSYKKAYSSHLRKSVLAIIRSQSETKFPAIGFSNLVDGHNVRVALDCIQEQSWGTQFPLTIRNSDGLMSIAQGDSANERIGDEITLSKFEVTGCLFANQDGEPIYQDPDEPQWPNGNTPTPRCVYTLMVVSSKLCAVKSIVDLYPQGPGNWFVNRGNTESSFPTGTLGDYGQRIDSEIYKVHWQQKFVLSGGLFQAVTAAYEPAELDAFADQSAPSPTRHFRINLLPFMRRRVKYTGAEANTVLIPTYLQLVCVAHTNAFHPMWHSSLAGAPIAHALGNRGNARALIEFQINTAFKDS